jgi:hypothetical protein
MTRISEIADRYKATWSENDPARRRDLIAELYASDAYYANQGSEYRGAAGLEVAVERNWEKFIRNGYTFEVAEGAAAHHRCARLPWRMLAPDAATVAAAGMQFLAFDDAGRVSSDCQFITQAPPA